MMLNCGGGGDDVGDDGGGEDVGDDDGGGVKDEDVGADGTNHDDEVRRQDASCGGDYSHNEPVEKAKQVT